MDENAASWRETQIYRDRLRGFSGHWCETILRESVHVMCLGVLGVLSRQGLTILFDTTLNISPKPLFPPLVANILGCSLLGFCMSAQSHIIKLTAPSIYIALASGYCGSFTTFSSFMLSTVTDICHGFVIRGILGIYIGLATAVTAFMWGRGIHESLRAAVSSCKQKKAATEESVSPKLEEHQHPTIMEDVNRVRQEIETTETADMWATTISMLGKLMFIGEDLETKTDDNESASPIPKDKSHISPQTFHHGTLLVGMILILIILYTLLVIAVTFDNSINRRKNFWWPAIFGPPGVLVRFHLSKLNSCFPLFAGRFPIGTFIANSAASLINGTLAGVSLRLEQRNVDQKYQHIIDAVMSGFSGSLSTMSTLAAELFALRLKYKWVYGSATIFVCVLLIMLTYGIINWTT